MERGDAYLVALGQAIREWRDRRGISQRDLARLVGTNQKNISAIERGEVDLRTRTQMRIARVLGTTSGRLDDRALDLLGDGPTGDDWVARVGGESDGADGEAYLKAVGDAIRERRDELHMTQGELGEQSGVGQQNLSLIERGKVDLRARTLKRLAEALGRTSARLDDRAAELVSDQRRSFNGAESHES